MSRASPIFLEKARYRRRRLMDAVRLLPFLGLGLWMVPLMWRLPGDGSEAATTGMAHALSFVFGVWLFLVLCAFVLWTRSRASMDPYDDGRS